MLIAFSKQFKHMSTHFKHHSQIVHKFDINVGHMLKTLSTHFQINFNTFPKSCLAHVQICFNWVSNQFENGVNTVSTQFPHMFNICSKKCNMSNTAPTHFRICSTYCQHICQTIAKPFPTHFQTMLKPVPAPFQYTPTLFPSHFQNSVNTFPVSVVCYLVPKLLLNGCEFVKIIFVTGWYKVTPWQIFPYRITGDERTSTRLEIQIHFWFKPIISRWVTPTRVSQHPPLLVSGRAVLQLNAPSLRATVTISWFPGRVPRNNFSMDQSIVSIADDGAVRGSY